MRLALRLSDRAAGAAQPLRRPSVHAWVLPRACAASLRRLLWGLQVGRDEVPLTVVADPAARIQARAVAEDGDRDRVPEAFRLGSAAHGTRRFAAPRTPCRRSSRIRYLPRPEPGPAEGGPR